MKVLTTTRLTSLQLDLNPSFSTHSSSVVTLSRPLTSSRFEITNNSFSCFSISLERTQLCFTNQSLPLSPLYLEVLSSFSLSPISSHYPLLLFSFIHGAKLAHHSLFWYALERLRALCINHFFISSFFH